MSPHLVRNPSTRSANLPYGGIRNFSELKRAFDPDGVFNRGRLYAEF